MPVLVVFQSPSETCCSGGLYFCTFRIRTCRAAALAVQNLVVEGKAQYAIKRVVSAIVDTGAVNLSFTNLRYHIAKYFGYVLPTEAIIEWMCTKYEGCK